MPLPLLLAQAAAPLDYRVATMPGGGYALTIARVPIARAAEFAAAVQREERARCGGLRVVPGKFTYTNEVSRKDGTPADPDVTDYRQEWRCVAGPPPAGFPVADDWKPDARDEQDARAFTLAYFAERDRGAFDAAYARYDPNGTTTRAFFVGEAARFAKDNGRSLGWTIDRTTWYPNPKDAPYRGAFVALDFHGRFAALDTMCGYLMLYRQGAGRYTIVREERGILPRAAVAGATPEAIASLRGKMQCR